MNKNILDQLCYSLQCVTKEFQKYKKKLRREERLNQKHWEELRKAEKQDKLSVKDAAFQVMEAAYMRASFNNTYSPESRQVMYAARPEIIRLTGNANPWKESSYFTQNILIEYMEKNPEIVNCWDVVFSARGTFIEPHTRREIPLGTIKVRNYIRLWNDDEKDGGNKANEKDQIDLKFVSRHYPTIGPDFRYNSVLFVEKEGFNEQLEQSGLLEQYDLALMSTKGLSTTAARHLVEKLTEKGVTIFVLHDFDEAGFKILRTLSSSNRRYKFEKKPNVIDLGLRLTDVKEKNLQSEAVIFKRRKKDPSINLRKCGATEDECKFLVTGRDRYSGEWQGERVEINAMLTNELIKFLDNKFKEHGVEKVIPDEEILKREYRTALFTGEINEAIRVIKKRYDDKNFRIDYHENLEEQILSKIEEDESLSWDGALINIIDEAKIKEEEMKRLLCLRQLCFIF